MLMSKWLLMNALIGWSGWEFLFTLDLYNCFMLCWVMKTKDAFFFWSFDSSDYDSNINHIHITQQRAKYLYLIATFRSPTANFIRHMVMWRWRWARDQNTIIVHWKVIGPASLFIQLASLHIRIDSLSCLVLRWPSVSKILAPDQSMTWFSFATWSVMAHLLVSVAKSFQSARVNVLLLMDSTSFLCSSCLFA